MWVTWTQGSGRQWWVGHGGGSTKISHVENLRSTTHVTVDCGRVHHMILAILIDH